MTTKKTTAVTPEDAPDEKEQKVKTCFVIMPIADHPDYEKDHFHRVYEYLIKPACISAGYQPHRADDSKASHMIMFDILKKIMDCDMAICDLSSKNANVFYELGLRQAFNKKTILITDGREKAPFDIAGFRYVTYSPSLRVDTVKLEMSNIAEMLFETENMPDDDVNSIVKLLKIQPARVDTIELNDSESMIFSMITKLQDKIDTIIDSNQNVEPRNSFEKIEKKATLTTKSFHDFFSTQSDEINNYLYELNGEKLGRYKGFAEGKFIFQLNSSSADIKIEANLDNFVNIKPYVRLRRIVN
jgi:hypothetical protein